MDKPSSINRAELSRLILDQSLRTLSDQQSIALARDQRSLVFATLSMTSAAFVLASLRQNFSGSDLMLGAAVFQAMAALLAAISVFPGKFSGPTEGFDELKEFYHQDHDPAEIRMGLAELYAVAARRNEAQAALAVSIFKLAVVMFATGVLLAILAMLTRQTG